MLDISHDGQASLPAQDSAEPSSWTRRGLTVTHSIEVLAAFAIGAAVMSFVYVDTRGISSQVNSLPGYDSWYHTKMAALLPEIGLVDDFPWLKFVYFKREGHDFVSHHTGFHAFLMPLVHLAKKWTGDYAPGARWAMSICFGLVLMLIYALLINEGIRWRWGPSRGRRGPVLSLCTRVTRTGSPAEPRPEMYPRLLQGR